MDWQFIWIIGILLFSVIIHEMAHGYVALFFGDKTASNNNRLTLNPIPHLDPVGSILLPAILIITSSPFLFGWAKPVPINPANFQNIKKGIILVSLAGPMANFILSILFLTGAIIMYSINPYNIDNIQLVLSGVFLNLMLFIFNLFPIPPLDGSKILFNLFNLKKLEKFVFTNQNIIFIIFIIFMFLTNILYYLTNFLYKILVIPLNYV